MIKTFAALIVIVAAILIFRPKIRELVYESSMTDHIQALELEPDQESRLLGLVDRVGDGYAGQVFNDQERATLLALSEEIEAGHDREWDAKKVQLLVGRLEAILRRHDL